MNKLAYDIIVFEKCNLKCQHCFECHNPSTEFDVETIVGSIERSLTSEIAVHNHIDLVTISLCGGELFMDGIGDEVFDKYDVLVNRLHSVAEQFTDRVEFEFISNGVFTKIDRVNHLLDKANRFVSISYDPAGRFKSPKQEAMCLGNIATFASIGKLWEVSITLTKQSIESYCHNPQKIIMLAPYEVGVNFFIPNSSTHNEHMMPDDEDLFMFFDLCVTNRLFNVKIINQLRNNIITKRSDRFCICDNRLIVRNGSVTYNCATYVPSYGGLENVEEKEIRFVKNNKGQIKRGCLQCEFQTVCPQMCWTSILFSGSKISKCPFERLMKNDTDYTILSTP